MERFMQELMVVTIDTRESQSDNTIALPTVSHCPYRFSIPNTSILYKEIFMSYFQLPEFQPEEADPLKMLDAWRNRAEWYEYSSGR